MRRCRRIREVASVVQKRLGIPENSVRHFAVTVENRAGCAVAPVALQHGRNEKVDRGVDDREDAPISAPGDSYSYTGTKGMCSTSSSTAKLAQGCVTGFKDVIVNSVEALVSALTQQLVSVVSEADSVFFQ